MGLDVDARILVGCMSDRVQACSVRPNRREGRIHTEAAAILACANVADRTSLRPATQRITQKLAQANGKGEGRITGRTWNGFA